MHDTACCFGYPSDSSRTARKRAGTLGWAGPRHWQAPPSDARPRQCSMMPPPPPRRPVLTVLILPRAASGVACKPKTMDVCWAGWGRDRSPARSPRSAPQGEAVGRGPGRSCRGWIVFAGSRVCGAGPVTGTSAGREARAPDRQRRAAAPAGGSQGRLQPDYHHSESDRASGRVILGGRLARSSQGILGARAACATVTALG
jgi:hypothetical protein